MKVISTFIAGAVLSVAATSSVSAAPAVVFKNPLGWAGTGCPAHTVSVTGADTATLSILFDSYEAGKDSETGKKRVACSFAVPIQVPRGFQLSHLTADWEVYAEGKGQFSRKYFLGGSPTIDWKRQNLSGGSGGKNFTMRDNLYHASLATGCNGGRYNLRINSEVKAKNRKKDYLAVDSADLNNKILLLLRFKKC